MNRQPRLKRYPGFVDIHDHFRWPSPKNKSENFKTGTYAAVLGGVVMTNDMPNTPEHHTNTPERLDEKHAGGWEQSYHALGFYTLLDLINNNVKQLAPMSERSLAAKGYLGPTTGFESLDNVSQNILDELVKEWHRVASDKPIMIHRGQADMEQIIYYIAKKHDHHVHFCHLNSPDEVTLIKRARAEGLPVTGGVTMHHLLKTAHNRISEGSMLDMVPTLTNDTNADLLIDHLAAGDIQNVETDHAPHPFEDKFKAEVDNHDISATCDGVPGVQETLGLLLNLVRIGRLSEERAVDAYSTQPARLMGVKFSRHTYVDVTDELYLIDKDYPIASGAGHSIYLGSWAVGKVWEMQKLGKTVIHEGQVVGRAPQVVSERGTEI